MRSKTLSKSRNRVFAGVCGGIAEYFGVDPTLVRVLAVVASFAGVIVGGIIAYCVCAAIMPGAE